MKLIKRFRAFSCDVMLSSNMTACCINGSSFVQVSGYVIVHNGISMSSSIRGSSAWSRACMVRVTALDIQVSLCNPTAMMEDSMTSAKMLYRMNSKSLAPPTPRFCPGAPTNLN